MMPLHRCLNSVSRSYPFSVAITRRFSFSSKADHPSTSSLLPIPRLDYRSISDNPVYKATNALNRKSRLPTGAIESISRTYKEHKNVSSVLNAKRNLRSVIGERIRRSAEQKDEREKAAALEEAKKVKDEILGLEAKLISLEEQLLNLSLTIPNDTHPLSPLGPEANAVTLSTHGPPPLPSNPERDHAAIGRKLGLIDFESGSTVTGSSWYYLLNEAALLEIALTNYALSIAIKYGFTPVTTPDVVRLDIASRCGFQPRDSPDSAPSQTYHINSPPSSPELVLSGTAEIPLAGMFADKIFPTASLPLRVVGLGRAFRSEAGARGVDTRGLYRVHQFTKLELFAVTTPEGSEALMEEMARIQADILKGLDLSFRILDMPSEELGASAYRKYDMEAWMPGRGSWGEVTSLSNCTDYQARRLHIRYRPQASSHSTSSSSLPFYPPHASTGIPFAHTLNGTAAAIPRLILALLENGARFDGKGNVIGLSLPPALKPFWIGGSDDRDIIRWESRDIAPSVH